MLTRLHPFGGGVRWGRAASASRRSHDVPHRRDRRHRSGRRVHPGGRAAGPLYLPETIEEAYASRAHYGAPHWEVTAWISSSLAIAAGDLAGVSGDVRALTGHHPVGLEAWVAAHPEALAHLTSPVD